MSRRARRRPALPGATVINPCASAHIAPRGLRPIGKRVRADGDAPRRVSRTGRSAGDKPGGAIRPPGVPAQGGGGVTPPRAGPPGVRAGCLRPSQTAPTAPGGETATRVPPALRRMRRHARRRDGAPRAPTPSVPYGAPGEGRPPSPQPPNREPEGRGDGLSRWGAGWRRNAFRLPHQ